VHNLQIIAAGDSKPTDSVYTRLRFKTLAAEYSKSGVENTLS
jgi:hypothetical protein